MVTFEDTNLPSLDQPMTNTTAVDSKMFVQSTGPVVSAQVRSNFEEMTAASSSMSGVRRRSGPQGLRSPTAKRPVSAPVALQGWLYKQGSEGLMLWKKRWFVLTDYCLFYYKGPEEEKLLGSILLPSYKVSMCRPEEKVNKKFAFKAEHANMRTYHFAAESRESMNQWVNALTLATLLQDPTLAVNGTVAVHGGGTADGDLSGRPSVSSMSSYLNQSADDSDSGFHGFQSRDVPSQVTNENSSPNSINTNVFSEHNVNSCNGNSHSDGKAISKNVIPNEVQPTMNGRIQQSPPYSETGSLKKQMQHHQECSQQRPVLLQPHSEHQHMSQTQRHMHVLMQQQKEVSQLNYDDSKTETLRSTPRKFAHPVYANAPPKPRRLTDNQNDYPTMAYGTVADYRKSPISVNSGTTGKNLTPDYGRNGVAYMTKAGLQQSQSAVRTDKSGLNYGHSHLQNSERRTPDTYGRSDKLRNSKTNGDYEDIYGIPQLYQRPSEPVGYNKGTVPVPISFPVYLQQRQQGQPYLSQYQHLPASIAHENAMSKESRVQPPRPHSADFLEFESTRRSQQQNTALNSELSNPQRRPQRPKSSLDVVNPSDVVNDNYFYSEERYAAQMRQSAAYLHQTPQHHQQLRNQSLSRATTPSKTFSRENDNDDETSNFSNPTDHVHHDHIYEQQKLPQLLQRHAGTCINEAKLRRSLRERRSDWGNCDVTITGGETENKSRKMAHGYESSIDRRKVSNHIDDTNEIERSYPGYNTSPRSIEQQQFARSASARLPRTRHPALLEQNHHEHGYDLSSSGQDSRDGERKMQQREESMKRLLEWKQRMLQSPLTRKPSASTYRGTVQNELSSYYKQQAAYELAAQEASVSEVRHSRRKDDVHRPHLRSKSTDGRRTAASVPRYSSYSSDDEDLGDVRRKRTRRPSHAGRSPRHFGDNNRPSASPAQAICIPTVESPRRAPNDTNNADVSKVPLVCGSIPPDAGYEEIDFRSILKTSSTHLNDIADAPTKISEPYSSLKYNMLKKPASILKTSSSSSRSVNQERSNAECIRGNSWNASKNVQWNSTNSKEEWDEREVIKEFSYQYIKPEDAQKVENPNDRFAMSKNVNLVQSRIKSFESHIDCPSPVKEVLSMQEPLKISASQATKAHVSKLDSSVESTSNNHDDDNMTRQKSIEKFHAKQASTDSNKSVKDLLADFERKSQLVKQERNKVATVQHRGVFSDTEALLYDTESDHDQREKSEEEQEEERKEKQAQRIKMQFADNDGVRKMDELELSQREMVTEMNSTTTKVVQESDDVSITVNTRLSLAESLVTHGDQLSGESGETSPISKSEDINLEEHYLPMSPRKAILDPNNDNLQNPKMMENLFANLEHEESSYVEMTHNAMSHSLLAPNPERNKHDSGDYSTLDTAHYELVCVSDNKMEPVYMEVNQIANNEEKEMNEKMMKKAERITNISPSRSDLPDIVTILKSDSSDADDESSRDLDSVDAPRHPRFSLSDTFRPASYYLGVSRTMIAELHDSSDSELVSPPPIPTSPPPLEDLDSLEMQDSTMVKNVQGISMKNSKVWSKAMGQTPSQRPSSRFSDAAMNSTFRDSRISLESASGSDSVELRNHDENTRRHKQLKRRPVSNEVCEVLDSLEELESIGSRFDGTSIDVDQYFEELQARDAFNLNLYTKDLSYNSIYGFNENVPVADKLQKSICHDVSRKINLISKGTFNQPFRHETRSKTSSASSLPSMRVTDLPPSHQHSQSFTGDMHYENISSFSPLRRSPAVRSDSEPIETESQQMHSHTDQIIVSHSRESSFSITSNIAPTATSSRKQVPEHHTQLSIDSSNSAHHLNYSLNSITQDAEQKLQRQDLGQYSRQIVRPNSRQSHLVERERDGRCSQTDQTGAPYYYSDLQAGVSSTETQLTRMVGHTSRLPQLNNQRDDAQRLSKRNDISRLVNPIPRQMPRQIPVDDAEEARRIAAELTKTTCRLLSDSKAGLVDKRNLYEADTLRRVKSTDPLPDPFLSDINSVNLYPQGVRDKSSPLENVDDATEDSSRILQVSHRRSRSLEDLLDDVDLQNLMRLENRTNRVSSVSPFRERVDNRENVRNDPPVSVEDPWEQDSLWRENLRRVSLRHARSLDNLENSPRQVAANVEPKGRNRITRGATYVNDSVNVRRETYLGESLSDRQSGKYTDEEEIDENQMLQPPSNFNYELLPINRLSSNDTWNRESRTSRKPTEDDMNNFLDTTEHPLRMIQPNRMPTGSSSTSFELDREKLRQWDLLSSACLLEEQQRTSLADSSRELPSIERFGDARDLRTSNTDCLAITNDDNGTTNIVLSSQTNKSNDLCEVRLDLIDNLPEPQPLSTTVQTFSEEELKEVRDRPTASGSGSVIGRDPLPPRAMSTSELPQSQSPAIVSTLPLLRTRNNRCVRPLPLHQSNPDATARSKDYSSATNSSHAELSNNGHGSSTDVTSSWQTTHLPNAAPHLRVISPVSSPSDSEAHYHGSSERILASPLEREANQTNTVYGLQADFLPNSNEQLYKRSTARLQQTGVSSSKPIHNGSGGLAGELLGRTHEELVLLLIQLRRQSATLCKAMETCRMEIDAQARLSELDTPRRLENLQKLEDLKRHLLELEKQYDKGKPLVNLVDNMVKLGSLYNRHTGHGNESTAVDDSDDLTKNLRNNRERVEFNQRVQEQRLLAEERKDWDRLSSDHGQLQAKVQQLYKLDRLLQEESGTLQGLQHDKEVLEKALGGLRYKLQGNKINSVEAERYKKQQVMLERELSRVRLLLAHNSKKLEETVAENARLEQDLVVLRQKLQASRRYNGTMVRDTSGTTAVLESELRRVQQLVGDLQRQRQELSIQVRQLTEKSHNLAQQIMPQPASVPQVHHLKKRTQNSWLVTDLDSGITVDHGTDRKESPSPSNSSRSKQVESNDLLHMSAPSTQSNEQSIPFTESSGYCSSPSYRQENETSYRQSSQNHIAALSPQLREQIQQHQLKQQLLKDQMQGKNSPVLANVLPLYINTQIASIDGAKFENELKNTPGSPPAYIPPPLPPQSVSSSEDALLMNGLMHNREKQEIKTVRIVKRESERRQRDRGEKTGNVGIPLTHSYQNSEVAKTFAEADTGSAPQFENDLVKKVTEDSRMTHAQNTHQLLLGKDDLHFQRSMSLPRGFGGHPGVQQGPVQPPPRSDSMHALKNIMARRYKFRFDQPAGGSESTLSPYTDSSTSSSHIPLSPSNYSTSPSSYSTSTHDNFYHARTSNEVLQPYKAEHLYDGPTMPMKTESSELLSPTMSGSQENKRYGSAASIASLSESLQSSPIFKSEAAKQIIKEVSELKIEGPKKRQIPKKKRRHYTVSSSKPVLDLEDTFSKMEIGRARDDLDMERALRPRINTPDVVRSTLGHKELKYNESTIDQLLGTPNKIVIPERYIPEQGPELTVEEQRHRLKKADAIRKMLSETTVTASEGAGDNVHLQKSGTLKKKVAEEKKQREHILQLNQILAKQVMEKSKMVAVKALATLPLNTDAYFDDEDLSPVIPLPIYQQRENFYS